MKANEQETPVPVVYLVECYWPGVTRAAVDAALRRTRAAAAEISATGRPVRLVRSTFVPSDEAVLALFEAIRADEVREAAEQAGLSAARISVAEDVGLPTREPSLLRLAFMLRSVAALASLAAAAIHTTQIEVHLAEWLPSGGFFIVLAALQAIAAPAILLLRSRRVDLGVILLSMGAVAAWFVSRTVGLPFGPAAGVPEAMAIPDLVATTFEVVSAASLGLIHGPYARRLENVSFRFRHACPVVLTVAVMLASLTGLALRPAGAHVHSHGAANEEQRPASLTPVQLFEQHDEHDACDLGVTQQTHVHDENGGGIAAHEEAATHVHGENSGGIAAHEGVASC